MFSAKSAINNIIEAEIERKTINFNRTIASLMSLVWIRAPLFLREIRMISSLSIVGKRFLMLSSNLY